MYVWSGVSKLDNWTTNQAIYMNSGMQLQISFALWNEFEHRGGVLGLYTEVRFFFLVCQRYKERR